MASIERISEEEMHAHVSIGGLLAVQPVVKDHSEQSRMDRKAGDGDRPTAAWRGKSDTAKSRVL